MKLKITCLWILFLIGFNNSSIGQNILISDKNNPNEPSITIDPNNTSVLLAAANLNNYYVSTDQGKTWTKRTLTSTYGVWGDPVLEIDNQGDFYFFHLSNPEESIGSWVDRIVCQKSTDQGKTWNNGTHTGRNGEKVQDKHWSVIDRSTNCIYLTWTQFDKYGSEDINCKTVILFSKSKDAGKTWSKPTQVSILPGNCSDSDNTVEGAVPAIGPNGEIYVAWSGPNGLVFNKSIDDGETWLEEEIFIAELPGGWNFNIPGIYRSNGLPVTKCDLSGGPNHGTIYVNWSDQRNGINNTDIWLAKSVDGGQSWTEPIRVNNDEGEKHQFFNWMDIDQTNGNLAFVFYDRRNHEGIETDVYCAFSDNGGETFTNTKISDRPFIPNEEIFFGDYTNIVAHDNVIRPIWTRMHDNKLSIWTELSPKTENVVAIEELTEKNNADIKQYPNPSKDVSFVSFKLHKTSDVSIFLFDSKGRKVHEVMNKERKGYGKYIVPIHVNKLNLPSGMYHVQLIIDDNVKNLKMLVVK